MSIGAQASDPIPKLHGVVFWIETCTPEVCATLTLCEPSRCCINFNVPVVGWMLLYRMLADSCLLHQTRGILNHNTLRLFFATRCQYTQAIG